VRRWAMTDGETTERGENAHMYRLTNARGGEEQASTSTDLAIQRDKW
jgi:hypothetical protein